MRLTLEDCHRLINNLNDKTLIRKTLVKAFSDIQNFDTFCRFILPKAFTKPFAEFHREIIDDFVKPTDSVVAAPRGHGKSTLIGLGFVLWLIVNRFERYIVYTSQNHSKSTQFLEPIKMELKTNDLLLWIYPELHVKHVRDENNKDREDCFDVNYIRIQAVSFEKNIRGLKYGVTRPTLIILDDIEDDHRVLNPELRRKDTNKLNKQIIPALDPERGRYKMIGTILHLDSLLVKKLNNLNGKVYKAILTDGTPLFPELYSLEKLAAIKYSIGSASFQSEYMNEPVDDAKTIIKREWIKASFCEELSFFHNPRTYLRRVQGVDFAFSDRVSADKSAFVAVGKTEEGYDVIQCVTKKGLTITQQFDYIEMLSGQMGYDDNALEENSIRSMSNELRNYHFPYTLFWTAGADPKTSRKTNDPEYTDKRHTIGKADMINRLATQFENGRIRIPYQTDKDKEIAHIIMDELLTFARDDGVLVEIGVHADIPIALAYAIEDMELSKFEFIGGFLEV